MKKEMIFVFLYFLLVNSFSYAFSDSVVIKVNGLVCEFCVKSIEKVLYKQPEVENVLINLSDVSVKVDFKKGQTLTDHQIKQLINDAGYDVSGIDRF